MRAEGLLAVRIFRSFSRRPKSAANVGGERGRLGMIVSKHDSVGAAWQMYESQGFGELLHIER